MTVLYPLAHQSTLDSDIARIILTFHRHELMAPRRHEIGSLGEYQSLGSQSRPSHNSDYPRRRSVAIQDLLNPVGEDNRSSPQSQEHHFQYPSSDPGRTSSRHSSVDRESNVSAQSRLSGGRRSPPRVHGRREFRPTYTEEEVHFIWYHRIDLGWEWKEVLNAFHTQFPGRLRGASGIQCKYYRHLEGHGIPQVRQRDRKAMAAQEYGLRARTGLWYPWMR
ncbi:MAG: hypothetical protein Q9166_003433 [cf. Caloplaca sp. 2 TL-2023]